MAAKRFIVGTMDTQHGWETQSPDTAISKHVTYWFQSRENQGKVIGDVPSFYMIFQKYSRQPEEMEKQTREKFKAYLEELFDDVLVEVIRQNLTGQANNYRLILTARVLVDDIKYDIAQTILVTGELYKTLDLERIKK